VVNKKYKDENHPPHPTFNKYPFTFKPEDDLPTNRNIKVILSSVQSVSWFLL
jgi:hypothetical protein